jgi:tetratricopeptide (TPR) repeat protein
MTLRSLPVCLFVAANAVGLSGCDKPATTAIGSPNAGAASPAPPSAAACARVLAPLPAGGVLGEEIAGLQKRADGPLRVIALEQLGHSLVARARLMNDPGLYDAALDAASCLDAAEPASPRAGLLRGHIFHQQHRFKEAEAIARTLSSTRGSALDYGLLGDALMEQGRLDEAGRAYQTMIDLKPFYQSYTRAAHLRWLRGDLNGAVKMMELALSSASPRDPEAAPWARTRLAFYRLQQGRLDEADKGCDLVLRDRPGYVPALIVSGRLHLARKAYTSAVDVLRRAVSAEPLPEAQWLLADALRLVGAVDEAATLEAEVERDGRLRDPRTFTLFAATRRRAPADAIAVAERELDVRADVFTHDALAWALASGGRLDEARVHMKLALAAGTRDARLFLHAAALASSARQPAEARRWLRKVRPLAATLLPSERHLLETLTATEG